MPPDQDEKTEPATQKRREDSREKGQVAKSREVTSVAVLAAGIAYFHYFGASMGNSLLKTARYFFTAASTQVETPDAALKALLEAAMGLGNAILPLMVLVIVFSLASQILQFGFLFSPKALVPKFSKLNPLEGVKRLLGKQGWMDLFKSIAKIALVGYVGYFTIREAWVLLPQLTQMEAHGILVQFADIALKIAIRCAAVLIILAAIDYAFQRYSFEQSIKMTKDEVKQEFKQREGDPLVKSRVRQIQREISRKRMMSSVPEADVVITNPTHFAIAIQYDREKMEAPMVVAKGRGFVAQKIREVAEEHNIVIVENKPLARGLYQAVQVGEAIPGDFYKAVAEVLAYVYTLNRAAA
ncbi:MAG: flagellar biosynthesis protein FlhB [Nitrospinota bacterium]